MLGREVKKTIDCNGIDYIFSQVDSYFRDDVFTTANLEAPFCIGGEKFQYKDTHLTFRINPKYVNVLTHMRVNAVTLANNHIMDYGAKGIVETVKALREVGIQHTGAGIDFYDAQNPIFVKGKDDIAILAFNLYTPFVRSAKKKQPGTISFNDHSIRLSISEALKKSKTIILVLHWGIDYHEHPIPCQIRKLKKIIDRYPCIIAVVCHHPHLIQPIIYHKTIPIICSIGNFLFDEPFKLSRIGVILNLNIEDSSIANMEFNFFKLCEDFRVCSLPPEEEAEEKSRLHLIQQNIMNKAKIYYDMDKKWYNILMVDIILHQSRDSLNLLFCLYNFFEISYYLLILIASVPVKLFKRVFKHV
jgi:poly-gamma-glutamate synthesis protein (capsule biosynthesis protein)